MCITFHEQQNKVYEAHHNNYFAVSNRIPKTIDKKTVTKMKLSDVFDQLN